ncbi:unnamed protein product [Linum trigynum]|uniref:Retrotransposon Copia-like N-terminal domain-containing protein n=1 Tax=Linum trigynum TaxID=586398 RepID=A0AAV2D0A9_9ROSI
MVSELTAMDSQRLSVRLNHKNYALWEFQFRVFVEGHGLLGVLNGTTVKPAAPATDQEIARWEQSDARIRSWLLGCVDPMIALGLRMHSTAHGMWAHLAATYSTVNTARQFELQIALGRLEQGNKDVASYFSEAQELWIEQDLLTASLRSKEASAEVMEERQHARLCQFLMKLRPEFETVRSTLLNRDDLKLDGILGLLVREEIRLRTQAQLDIRPGKGETVIAASAVSDQLSSAAFAVQKPHFQRRVAAADVECHHCHEKCHYQKHCRKKNFCVYCKSRGHIVTDCKSAQRAAARANDPRSTSTDRAGGDRPVYATPAAVDAAPPSAINAAAAEQLVSAALQCSLPSAISSAFAALQVTGHDDGEADRARE